MNVTSHIFLLEVDDVILSHIKENEYAWLKGIVCSSSCIIWVSRDQGSKVPRPEFDMITGFARSIRSEYSLLKFVTLALDGMVSPIASTENIVKVLRQTIISTVGHMEPDYRQQNDVLEIGRLAGFNSLNRMLAAKTAYQESEVQKFANGIPMGLHVAAPRSLDSLEFREDYEAIQSLSDDAIEVEVKATGVNFRDCIIALGQLSDDSIGSQGAGVVARIGKHVTAFSVGDRVSVSSLNAYKTYMRAKESCAFRIPDDMSFIQAASLPTAALAVYHAFVNVARLQRGETVLVHSGAGATGQLAIQLAQHLQAEIYTTVGSEDKKQLIMQI